MTFSLKSPYICLRRGLTKERITICTDNQFVIIALAANRAGILLVAYLMENRNNISEIMA